MSTSPSANDPRHDSSLASADRRSVVRADGANPLLDPARLHLLAETGLIEASAVARIPTLDRVARLAAHATRSALAQVNLITADAQVPAAAFVDDARPGPYGDALSQTDAAPLGAWRVPVGLDASYCKHVVASGAALVIDDAQRHELVRENVATTKGGIGAYASVPLTTPGGVVLGTVCVVDFHARHWTESDIAALTECAAIAGEEVAARLGASHALRESEQRLRLALQAAHLGSWSRDLRTDTVVASVQCKALFGFGPDDQFTYASMLDVVHGDDIEAVRAAMLRAVREQSEYEAEYRVIQPDGSVRWIAAFGQPMYDLNGDPLRMVGLVQDVTDRHNAADERERLLEAERAARAEAEQANRAKSEFLAVMSHELRTPLNAIGGYAELIELGVRGEVTAEQREDLRRIRVSQRHLLSLINEMLNYTRLESGTVQYARDVVYMHGKLAEAEELVAPQVRAKGLTLEVMECAPDLAAVGDHEKVRQILANLLSNAVKFTPRGGHLVIQCESHDDVLQVAVRDTGIGIPQDKLDAIFDPFVQVRTDLTRPSDGTGLGLAISRALARGMGGELTVESNEGSGSTFTLVLPRHITG